MRITLDEMLLCMAFILLQIQHLLPGNEPLIARKSRNALEIRSLPGRRQTLDITQLGLKFKWNDKYNKQTTCMHNYMYNMTLKQDIQISESENVHICREEKRPVSNRLMPF
ncbi:hypothetical protein FKM82_027921 [Ascaphus truei]